MSLKEGTELNLTPEEQAFYDALSKPETCQRSL